MDTFQRLSKAIRRRIHVPVLRDEPPDHRAAIFVAGSGRSGTSWVAELIAYSMKRRYVFEPLHGEEKPYLHPSEYRPELQAFLEAVLEGRTRSRWTERFNRTLISQGRVVKEIRANLMLGWIQKQFPEMPIVLVLRHPCAVAASFVREGWKGRLAEMLQGSLVKDHLLPHQDAMLCKIACTGTKFERAIGMWCLETLVALRQIKLGRWATVIQHERLVEDPETLAKLSLWCDTASILKMIASSSRPSLTSRSNAPAWRSIVTPYQAHGAQEMLQAMGLDLFYSAHSPLPKRHIDSAMLEEWRLPWEANIP